MRHPNRQRGVVYIIVLFLALAMVAFIGLAIDTFHTVLTGQQLQIGADASALAGATYVRLDLPAGITAANTFANANFAFKESILLNANPDNLADGDIVLGRYNREEKIFYPRTTAVNAIKVVARRNTGAASGELPLLFGPIFGVDTTNVKRYAIAMNGGSTGGGIIALNLTEPCSFKISGSTILDVDNGAIYVNSSAAPSACHNGANTSFTSPEMNIMETATVDRMFEEQVTTVPGFEINPMEEPIIDPLLYLDPPYYNTDNDLGTRDVTGNDTVANLEPGFYSGGISMSSGTINMAPGIYIVDGEGFDIRGGDVLAEGVMIYIIDSTPDDNTESHVYLGGNGVINISGPDPELHNFDGANYYEGVTFFQAREDLTADPPILGNTNEATIIGTGDMNLEGTFYFPENKLYASGTNITIGNQLIVDQIELNGNGTITINYDGDHPWIGDRVYLVE